MGNYDAEELFGLMKMLINEVYGLNRNLKELIELKEDFNEKFGDSMSEIATALKDIDWAIQHTN